MFNFDWFTTAFDYFMGIEMGLGWKILLVVGIIYWLLGVSANFVRYLQKRTAYKEMMVKRNLEEVEELTGKMH